MEIDYLAHRREKLRAYTGAGDIQEILANPSSVFLPPITVTPWGSDRRIRVLGSITPHYKTDWRNNKQIRMYAVDVNLMLGQIDVVGYWGAAIYKATESYATAEHTIATWSNLSGLGTALEASGSFVLSNLSSFTLSLQGGMIYIRSFDENGAELAVLEESVTDAGLIEGRRRQRESWLHLYGDHGIAGFSRCVDDPRYIEKHVSVFSNSGSTRTCDTINLIRTDRGTLYNHVECKGQGVPQELQRERFGELVSTSFFNNA